MKPTDPQDFEKVIAKHKKNLADIKAVLEDQSTMLDALVTEFGKFEMDKNALPPLEALPQEYQDQYLAFTRELKDMEEILNPKQAKAKPALRRTRSMI